jgi:hypothetical protein
VGRKLFLLKKPLWEGRKTPTSSFENAPNGDEARRTDHGPAYVLQLTKRSGYSLWFPRHSTTGAETMAMPFGDFFSILAFFNKYSRNEPVKSFFF